MGDILEIYTPSHRDQLFEGICRLLDSDVGSDFEFSCTNSEPIKAHFVVLQIFCQILQNSSCRRIRFESAEIKREDLYCLVEFIYRGKTRIEVDRLNVVKRVAVKLGLRTFLDVVEGIKIIENGQEEVENELLGNESASINIEKNDTEIEEKFIVSMAEGGEVSDEYLDQDYVEESEEEEKFADVLANACENVGNDVTIRKHSRVFQKCFLCAYRGRNLEAHLATQHQMDSNGQILEKSVKCDECEFTCVADFILKTHKKIVHCAAEYKCDECAYECHDNYKLTRHKQLIHSDERTHMCEICGKCFKAADSLRNHKIMHSEKVDCEICGKKFSMVSIRRHRKLHDAGANIIRYKCTLCAFRSRYRFNLKVHFKKIHDMSEEEIAPVINSEAVRVTKEEPQPDEVEMGKRRRSFKCRKKRVPKPKTKSPPKKRVCEICGVVLSCASVLFRHRRLHREGDSLRGRYKCSLCEFKTRERYNLKTHCVKKHRMSEEQFNVMFDMVTNELATTAAEESELLIPKNETYVMVDADIVNSILYA